MFPKTADIRFITVSFVCTIEGSSYINNLSCFVFTSSSLPSPYTFVRCVFIEYFHYLQYKLLHSLVIK